MKERQQCRNVDGFLESAVAARWNRVVCGADHVIFEPVFLVSRVPREHFGLHETAGPLCYRPSEPEPDTASGLARFYFLQ
jgi:hypothetical protein